MKTILTSAGENTADIVGHIFQVPFIHQPVDLTGFFVSLVGGVSIVDNAHKANPPNREQTMNVLFYKLQFAGKS